MWHLLPLGNGGSSQSGLGVAPTIGMLSMGCGEGCYLLGLGDYLGTSVGETAAVGCFSMGEVLCGITSGGNAGICLSKRWYETASALLRDGGLLNKMTCQAERKSLWLLLSSPMACSSRSHMYLPCLVWTLQSERSFGLWPHRWLWNR